MIGEQLIALFVGIIGGCTMITVVAFAYYIYWDVKAEKERLKIERERWEGWRKR